MRHEGVYALTDLTPDDADAATLGAVWRGHWGIENRLHGVRDWAWDEDRSTVRTGAGPQVMATLRHTALSPPTARRLRHHPGARASRSASRARRRLLGLQASRARSVPARPARSAGTA